MSDDMRAWSDGVGVGLNAARSRGGISGCPLSRRTCCLVSGASRRQKRQSSWHAACSAPREILGASRRGVPPQPNRAIFAVSVRLTCRPTMCIGQRCACGCLSVLACGTKAQRHDLLAFRKSQRFGRHGDSKCHRLRRSACHAPVWEVGDAIIGREIQRAPASASPRAGRASARALRRGPPSSVLRDRAIRNIAVRTHDAKAMRGRRWPVKVSACRIHSA